MSSRNQFGRFLNERGLVNQAVEIGTHRADYAVVFLNTWKGRYLHCVDPWRNHPSYERQAQCLTGGGIDRDEDWRIALSTMEKQHEGRFRFHRMTSQLASQQFRNRSLDFVYIDGDHSFEAVRLDLILWWPKLCAGGVIAGHDFICPGEINGGWGAFIQPAVLQFATAKGIDINLIVEEGGLPWSFYMIKP